MSGASVFYAIDGNGDFFWHRHEGAGEQATWADSHGRKIGNGWKFRHLFSGDRGVVYAVTDAGDLLWYRHNSYNNGTESWADNSGVKVGVGWNVREVFSGGNGVIYAIFDNGDLYWYRHLGYADGSPRWTSGQGRKIGTGWNGFKQVFSGYGGIIYALTHSGDLLWYQHTGTTDGAATWVDGTGRKVGNGWNFRRVLSSGDGIMYAVAENGDLYWNWHLGWGSGEYKWQKPVSVVVGYGWNVNHLLTFYTGADYDVPTSEDFGWGSFLQGATPASGERPAVVVLTEYDVDASGRFVTLSDVHSIDYYRRLAFGNPTPPFTTTDPVQPASLNAYLRECSGGRFGLRNRGVVGPLRLGPYPDPDPGPEQRFRTILARAAKEHPDVFSRLDTNQDLSIGSDELLVLSVENFRPPIGWPANRDNVPVRIDLPAPEQPATVAVHVAGVGPYTPFYQIGHEFSHSLGTRDMYNNGAGNSLLTLMGGYDFFSNDQATVHLDAWHKMALGWCRPTVQRINGTGHHQVAEITAKTTTGPLVLWNPQHRTGEYFLVERRTPRSKVNVYDSAVAGDGILVWRVVSSAPAPPTHLGAPDLAPGGNGVWALGTTTPPLTWSDGSSVGIRLAVSAGAAGTSNLRVTQVPA